MTQRATTQLYTALEFEKMPEFHQRYELIHGRLVQKPMPKYEHGWIVKTIMRAVARFDPDENAGVILPEVSVEIAPNYTPMPDLSFWVAERAPDRKVTTAPHPDLAIEVQSPGQTVKDLLQKAKDYPGAGVKIVWVVQPDKKLVTVLRQGQDLPVTIQSDGELDGEDVLPGFKLPVQSLFE